LATPPKKATSGLNTD